MVKVSIIIPVYNVAPYIKRCLLSALNQTYDNIEIILADDCGQDNSMNIADQIIKNHKNKKKVNVLKHPQNKGLSAARNTGIKNATGKYIYFLDSDDEIPLNTIEKLVDLAIKYNPDFVIGNLSATNTNRDFSLKIKNTEFIEGNKKILKLFLLCQWHGTACNKLINKDFILTHNLYFYEGVYHEDDLWSFQLALKTESMAVYHATSYIYHIRANSISQNIKSKNIEDMLLIIKQMNDIIESDEELIKNVNITTYYESYKFRILIYATITTEWNLAYKKLENLFLNNRNLILKTSVTTIFKYVMMRFLPQNFLRFLLQHIQYIKNKK